MGKFCYEFHAQFLYFKYLSQTHTANILNINFVEVVLIVKVF